MKEILKESISLSVIAIILAFAVNTISSNGITVQGTWFDNRIQVELDEPLSYDPEFDSLLTMQDAFTLWNDSAAIFIDARDSDEYAEGHIPGAINLPFEEWDDYWEEVEPFIKPEDKIVCYCDGLDCELSLFAARELKAIGYPNSYIFFGGINKWLEHELPLETDIEE